MPQIPQIPGPVTGGKTLTSGNNNTPQNAEPFSINGVNAVQRPTGVTQRGDAAGAGDRGVPGDQSALPPGLQAAKDPSMAVETLHDVFSGELLENAKLNGYTELVGEIDDLTRAIYINPDKLMNEILTQEKDNTVFAGNQLFEILRDLCAESGEDTKELIANLLKTLNYAMSRNEILSAVKSNIGFLAEYFGKNTTLSKSLFQLYQKWDSGDPAENFESLKNETAALMRTIAGSLQNDSRTEVLVPLVTHNLSRYNTNEYMMKEAFTQLMSQVPKASVREGLSKAFTAFVNKLLAENTNSHNNNTTNSVKNQVLGENFDVSAEKAAVLVFLSKLAGGLESGNTAGRGINPEEMAPSENSSRAASSEGSVNGTTDESRNTAPGAANRNTQWTAGDQNAAAEKLRNTAAELRGLAEAVRFNGPAAANTAGKAVTVNPDGTVDIAGSDGTESTVEPDGTVVTENPDGTVVTAGPDGTVSTASPDGTSVTVSTDGTAVTAEPDGTTVTVTPGGTTVTASPDGTVVTASPDGTTVTVNPDGTVAAANPDGTAIPANPDGTVFTARPDGTVITASPDGTVVTASPDGTAVTANPDGTVVTANNGKAPEDPGRTADAAGERASESSEDSERAAAYKSLVPLSESRIAFVLNNYTSGLNSGRDAIDQLLTLLIPREDTDAAEMMHTVVKGTDNLTDMVNFLNRVLENIPDIPERQTLCDAFEQVINTMAKDHEMPTQQGSEYESETVKALTSFIERNVNHPAIRGIDNFNASNLLQSILNAPGVFTPLAHYIIPLQVEDTRAFGELWVDNDNTSGKNDTENGEKHYHLFLTFDVEAVGRFEVDAYSTGKELNLSVLYPKSYRYRVSALTDKITKIAAGVGFNIQNFKTGILIKPHTLAETFPRIKENRRSFDVKA